jgi:hypothetical protein
VYSRVDGVLVLEHCYYVAKSFAAVVREAFGNGCPDKDAPNKKTVYRLVTSVCLSVTSAHRETKHLKLRPYRRQAVHQLQWQDVTARIRRSHWFRRFVCGGVHV